MKFGVQKWAMLSTEAIRNAGYTEGECVQTSKGMRGKLATQQETGAAPDPEFGLKSGTMSKTRPNKQIRLQIKHVVKACCTAQCPVIRGHQNRSLSNGLVKP